MVAVMTNAERAKRFRERRLARGMREVRCWLKPEEIDLLHRLGDQYAESSHELISRALRVLAQVTDNQKHKKTTQAVPCRRRARLIAHNLYNNQ